MKCPLCQKRTKTIETKAIHQKVRRRKECLSCGVRFSTYELLDTDYQDLIDKNLEVRLIRL